MKFSFSDHLEPLAEKIRGSISEMTARSRVRLDYYKRKPSWIEVSDFADFSVPAKDYIGSVFALLFLDSSFDVTDQRQSLRMVMDRALGNVGIVSTKTKEERPRIFENVFDATAAIAIFLDGRESDKANQLLKAGLGVRQKAQGSRRLVNPNDDEEDDVICNTILRLFHLGQHESVLSEFENNLQVDPAAFSDDPATQMGVALYLLSASKCERGHSIENAEFGAKVWFDLSVFSWLAAKSRLEYSLESYRLFSLIAAFEGTVRQILPIDTDELVARMHRREIMK